jgi:hypothetical protein
MKIRTVISLTIVALLLVSSAAFRQPFDFPFPFTPFRVRASAQGSAQGSALAQSSGPPSLAGYAVQQGTVSGGGYLLASTTWQARGTASGGGYRLASPLALAGTGTPCCCTYLPCLLRNYP